MHQTGRKSFSCAGIFPYNKEGKPLSHCPQYTLFATSQILHKYRPQLLLYECNTQLRDQIIDRFSKADNAKNATSNVNAKSAHKELNVPPLGLDFRTTTARGNPDSGIRDNFAGEIRNSGL